MDNKMIVRKLSAIGIFGNIFLCAFKFIAGIAGHSAAMVSDAVHSLSDVLATGVAYVGTLLAGRDSDEDHPYGHERFECAAALILGAILIVTGGVIGLKGLQKIVRGEFASIAVPTILPLVAAVVSIVVKEAMYRYTMQYAIKMDSAVFKADAWHHRSDAASSIGSLIGILGARLGFPIMDPLASLVICVFIVKAALTILKDALSKMMDSSCDKNIEKDMMDHIAGIPGVKQILLLRTRMFGNRIYVDVEISADRNSTLVEAHDIAEAVHDELETAFPAVKHVMVHVDPEPEKTD